MLYRLDYVGGSRVGAGCHRTKKYPMTQVGVVKVEVTCLNKFFITVNWLFWEKMLRIIRKDENG